MAGPEYNYEGVAPALDLSTAAFWDTPLGRSVKAFWRLLERRRIPSPLTSGDIVRMIGLANPYVDNVIISGLMRARLMVGADREGHRYVFKPEHVLVSGLTLLHLERGYTREETVSQMGRLLADTILAPFVGDGQTRYYELLPRSRDFFAKDSPWLQFPLEPVSAREKAPPRAKKPAPRPRIVTEAKPLRIDRKFPTFQAEALAYLKGIEIQPTRDLLARIPNGPEEVDLVRDAPHHLQQAVMFIFKAHLHQLQTYNPDDSYSRTAFRRGLIVCIDYLEKYSNILNLEKLIRVVEQAVLREPQKYWRR